MNNYQKDRRADIPPDKQEAQRDIRLEKFQRSLERQWNEYQNNPLNPNLNFDGWVNEFKHALIKQYRKSDRFGNVSFWDFEQPTCQKCAVSLPEPSLVPTPSEPAEVQPDAPELREAAIANYYKVHEVNLPVKAGEQSEEFAERYAKLRAKEKPGVDYFELPADGQYKGECVVCRRETNITRLYRRNWPEIRETLDLLECIGH